MRSTGPRSRRTDPASLVSGIALPPIVSPGDAASHQTPPRMNAAARADSMLVENVIRLAAEGRLRTPSFQRKFRWGLPDRRAPLDSIYRGYPVGTLLLWKNPPERLAELDRDDAPPLAALARWSA